MKVCKHENWIAAGYPEHVYEGKYTKVESIYEVKCLDCGNFVNLLSGKIINNRGLVPSIGILKEFFDAVR